MRLANRYAVVEGKLIDLKNLEINASFRSNKNDLIVPTSSKNVFIKIGTDTVPQKVLMKDGELISEDQLRFFSK